MFSIVKERRCFIVEEKDVTTILAVINRHYHWPKHQKLVVTACGWEEEPTKWSVSFNASARQYDNILKDIIECNLLLTVNKRPKGKRNLCVEKGS